MLQRLQESQNLQSFQKKLLGGNRTKHWRRGVCPGSFIRRKDTPASPRVLRKSSGLTHNRKNTDTRIFVASAALLFVDFVFLFFSLSCCNVGEVNIVNDITRRGVINDNGKYNDTNNNKTDN